MKLKNLERRVQKAEARNGVGEELPTLFIRVTDARVRSDDGSSYTSPFTDDCLIGYTGAGLVERIPAETARQLEARCRLEQPRTRVFMAAYRNGAERGGLTVP